MTRIPPEVVWGDLVDHVKSKEPRKGMDYCLKPKASDKDKMDFEASMMAELGYFLKEFYPELEDPYYTWEGDIVERSSLKGRALPLVDA